MFAQPRIRKSAPPPPKKRKTTHAIEEITFDRDARAEYLTGFHKRKQARIKHAQEIAERKARQERIEMRKQIREQRRQAVEEHVEAINKILREAEHAGTTDQNKDSSEEEWEGLSDTDVPEPPIDLEEEYIDEDKYTTVTVEAVNVDRDGLRKPDLEESSEDEDSAPDEDGNGGNDPRKEANRTAKRSKDLTKKKKRKFRYETKFERDLEARKQKARRRKR
ncbi:nucleolar protein 12-domain-containing protein [Achaetomium macrosporum]|uniref:Nucleolar protein 12-domain-containing protein n=1 Tax=Achaetomium macrosporum TaxID=79813 RepID=A0AAN7CCA1_9PEZI|nr:nucleolar protein 12-domain-containing protein [Achaetomium macrosporum]